LAAKVRGYGEKDNNQKR